MINEALDFAQRKKRAMVFKRIRFKAQASKKRNQGRLASDEKIQKRARKGALNIVRKKVAGARGEDYKNLSTGEKIAVDKLVDKKRILIAKLSKRLIPVMRKKEKERLQSFNKNKNMRTEDMQKYSSLMEKINPDRLFEMNFKQGQLKMKDGSKYNLSSKDASVLNDFSKTLNSSNKKEFDVKAMESAESIKDLIGFAKETLK